MHELIAQGLVVKFEEPLVVYYKVHEVDEFRADLIVEDKVFLELKAQKTLHPASEAQVIYYLKIISLNLGLLINFSCPRASIKRIAL